ncbi:MAG: glycerophosphodiester phosphodiesterase family protein [Verrucomicrobiota bacterium]
MILYISPMKHRIPMLLLWLFPISSFPADPIVVAHRGASKDAPENTLPAFNLAWEQGADAIEGDFHLTADDKIVCIHDRDTEEVASVKKIVRQSTLAELKRLDVGSWKGKQWADTRIPTLAEVFENK